MENPFKIDDLGGTTIFGNIHLLLAGQVKNLNSCAAWSLEVAEDQYDPGRRTNSGSFGYGFCHNIWRYDMQGVYIFKYPKDLGPSNGRVWTCIVGVGSSK